MQSSKKILGDFKQMNPVEMASALVRAHGVDYAKRMVEKLVEDNAVETRVNLPVGPLFYDQVGPKDWRLKSQDLDKVLNYWTSTKDALKKYKGSKSKVMDNSTLELKK